jgi:hypothetical protein
VQPKNVTFPTDAKLLETAIRQLGKLAKAHGVPLRQSYACAFRRSRPLIPTHRGHPFRRIAATFRPGL